MPHYHVYVLDEHGHLMGGFDLDCTDDDVAREHARTVGGRTRGGALATGRAVQIRARHRPSGDERPSRPLIGPRSSDFNQSLREFGGLRLALFRSPRTPSSLSFASAT
jgi:hypothetical protein